MPRPALMSFAAWASLSAVTLFASSPVVTGPVAVKAAPGDPSHHYPFYAALGDLKARGYVEHEFFVSGSANRYETPDGATGTVIDGNHKYQTRIVVRRPIDAARFNGTVVVEWNNVTSGHDQDIDWFQIHDHLMRSGYAWIGVTAQRVGVEALKVWNKERYGSLDVSDGGTIVNDALSYDVFADVGRAARKPNGVDFLGGLKPQRVFATGHSQSSGRLTTYVNSVHPLDPVFDAVILHGGGGKVRTDLKIKVWKLNSETDISSVKARCVSRTRPTSAPGRWLVIHTSIRSLSPAAPSCGNATDSRPRPASALDCAAARPPPLPRLLRRNSPAPRRAISRRSVTCRSIT